MVCEAEVLECGTSASCLFPYVVGPRAGHGGDPGLESGCSVELYSLHGRQRPFRLAGKAPLMRALIVLTICILLAALAMSYLPGMLGALGGLSLAALISVGVLLVVGFVLLLVFSGVGLLVAGIVGLVGVILLAVALPLLAPLLIVVVPLVILFKLFGR